MITGSCAWINDSELQRAFACEEVVRLLPQTRLLDTATTDKTSPFFLTPLFLLCLLGLIFPSHYSVTGLSIPKSRTVADGKLATSRRWFSGTSWP